MKENVLLNQKGNKWGDISSTGFINLIMVLDKSLTAKHSCDKDSIGQNTEAKNMLIKRHQKPFVRR